MKSFCIALVPAALIATARPSPGHAQGASMPAANVDPRTGLFRPMVPRALSSGTPTDQRGNFKYNIKANLISSFPAGTNFTCGLLASYVAVDSLYNVTDDELETAQTPASVSGSSLSCVVSIPYEWSLYSLSGILSLMWSINVVSPNGQTARFTQQSGPAIALPATGTVLAFSASTHL